MFGLELAQKEIVHKHHGAFYKVLKSSLKYKKEPLLIISDYGSSTSKIASMVAYGYYYALRKRGLQADLIMQDVKKGFMHADIHIVQALTHIAPESLVVVAVSNKLGRFGPEKSFRGFCKEQGHRFLSATGLGDIPTSKFSFVIEAMNINYARLQKKGQMIKKVWDKARSIRIKTAAGTDITFDVEGMTAIANIGLYHSPGTGGNMPAGEVYIPPRGITNVQGTVVLDGSMKTADGAKLLDEPVTLIIEQGRVVRMVGKHAELLESTFRKFEDRAKYPERIRLVGELGVGINPAAVLIGSTILDEKVLGTAHIAVGSNAWFGGEIKTIFHGDQVFKDPEIYVDDQLMVI